MNLQEERQKILKQGNLIDSNLREETNTKVDYFKYVLEGLGELHESINDTIEKGSKKSKYLIMGLIPVFKKSKLSKEEIARLKVEQSEIEYNVYNKKKYYEQWLKRLNDIDLAIDEVTRECNDNFDKMLEDAKKLTYNLRLMGEIKNYNKDEATQDVKNAFYLFLKIEILNSKMNKRK